MSGPRHGVITLTTDFGLRDPYVAMMKGVLLTIAPGAQVVDITHEIAPQAVVEAALVLNLAGAYFPEGAVHVVVVDPGVGTARRRLAISARGHFFVGPDNGCLSAALPAGTRGERRAGEPYSVRAVSLSPAIVAVSIENEAFMRTPVSSTFEGRDVFAPAAAYLSNGGSIDDLGPRVDSLGSLPVFQAPAYEHGIDGVVLWVDRFGNLITDIHGADLPDAPTFSVAGHRIEGLHRTYAEAHGLAAIVGGSGLVEIALAGGGAALELGVGVGASVVVS